MERNGVLTFFGILFEHQVQHMFLEFFLDLDLEKLLVLNDSLPLLKLVDIYECLDFTTDEFPDGISLILYWNDYGFPLLSKS